MLCVCVCFFGLWNFFLGGSFVYLESSWLRFVCLCVVKLAKIASSYGAVSRETGHPGRKTGHRASTDTT